MIIGICIGGGVLLLILTLIIIISIRNGKKNSSKLDEALSKLNNEKNEINTKEKAEEVKKKEEEAFANITLSDDVEENNNEFENFFNNPSFPDPDLDELLPNANKTPRVEDFKEMDDFFNDVDKPKRKKVNKKLSRDEEFEKFMDEHAFSRRVFDKNLLEQIKSLPPKLKAIMLSNVFNKFDD